MSDKFFVSPAEGHRWGLSLDAVTEALQARWPDVVIHSEDLAPKRSLIDFHFEEGGHTRLGAYYTVPNEFLEMESTDLDIQPNVVAWFLRLMPPDVPNILYTASLEQPIPVPSRADESTLRAIYRRFE